MIRVLVFTTVWPTARLPHNGLFVRRRIEAAARTGADVVVVAPVPFRRAYDVAPREPERPTFWYVPGIAKCLDGFFLFASSFGTVRRVRRRFRFEIIDAHFGYPDGFAAALLSIALKVPFLITLRGSELVMARYVLRRQALRFVVRRAQAIIAVSTELAGLASELGAAPDRVTVIGNGVDLTEFAPLERPCARKRLGCEPDGPLVVCVGHLAPVKRFDLVADAVKRLRDRGIGVRLAIVGGEGAIEGGYGGELKRRVRDLGLDPYVRFPGAVDPSAVALWMNAADVFVLASEREGSPNVVLEALAVGTPVVATNVGDLAGTIGPATGILVGRHPDADELAGAIAAAINRSWDRDEIRKTVSTKSWSGVGQKVADLWRMVAVGSSLEPAAGAQVAGKQ